MDEIAFRAGTVPRCGNYDYNVNTPDLLAFLHSRQPDELALLILRTSSTVQKSVEEQILPILVSQKAGSNRGLSCSVRDQSAIG